MDAKHRRALVNYAQNAVCAAHEDSLQQCERKGQMTKLMRRAALDRLTVPIQRHKETPDPAVLPGAVQVDALVADPADEAQVN